MDSSILRPESHIAQQSRRDKLRIQSSFDFPNSFDPDLVQVRNLKNGDVFYDPIFPTQMLDFSMVGQELVPLQVPNRLVDSSSSSYPITCNFSSTPKMSTNDNWRSVDSHQNYEWTVNYASGSSRETNQKPMYVGDVLSNNARVTNSSNTSIQYLKPHYNGGYHHLDQSSTLINDEIQDHNQKQQLRDQMQFSNYNHINSLQDVVTPTSLYLDSNSHQWSSELGLITRRSDQGQELRNTQGLSLSLSSNPPSRANNIIAELGERYESEYLQSKLATSDYLCPKVTQKPAVVNSGKSPNEMTGTGTGTGTGTSNCNYALRNVGPLGPFTGYATILKSSKFLKPAQDLLDEFCNSTGSNLIPARICGEVNDASDTSEAGAKGNNNDFGISSAKFYSSNEDVGMSSTSGESYRPEYHQKKAKLLYLQEEVSRKHKQYHQQMQMVASSFEAVSGLNAATPYISLALKMVSRNFRDLKHAISDQLKRITRALGEDLLSPHVGGSSRGDTSTSKMRYMDQTLQRMKSSGAFFEPQQHAWRPQRGLPERSVAILKAWLYEHFLHPYPTDTDKHMLASQTGLSRNQVSNWFINARVRVWKPMVEEIHMLETKGMAESNRSCGNNEGKSTESTSQPNYEQAMNNVAPRSMMNKHLECSVSSAGSGGGEQMKNEEWNQEKRSRIEYEVASNMDGSVMNFVPYQRSGIDIGGIGAVSLTLGLRHSVDINVQQQQQQHEDHHQLRRRFGGQMIPDYVG